MRLSPGKSLIETCKTAEVGFGIGTNNLVPGRLEEDDLLQPLAALAAQNSSHKMNHSQDWDFAAISPIAY